MPVPTNIGGGRRLSNDRAIGGGVSEGEFSAHSRGTTSEYTDTEQPFHSSTGSNNNNNNKNNRSILKRFSGNGSYNSSMVGMNNMNGGAGGGREKIESTLDRWHEDDLSIVASEDDDNGSEDGHSLAASGAEGKAPKTAPSDLVRTETRAVMLLRYLILALMLIMGCLMAVGTFRWVEKAEDYEQQVSSGGSAIAGDSEACAWTGRDLQQAFGQSLQSNLDAGQINRFMAAFTLSASFTSFALSRDNTAADGGGSSTSTNSNSHEWPLVTIPHFDARVTGLLETLHASQIRLAPIVTSAFHTLFEEYAVAQQLAECATCPVAEQITNPSSDSPALETVTTIPIWQIAPFTTEPILLHNLLDNPNESTAVRQVQDFGAGIVSDLITTTTTTAATQDNNKDGPQVTMVYPVFTDFQQVTMAAVLTFTWSWKTLLEQAVPFDLQLQSQGENIFSILLESCSGQVSSYGVKSNAAAGNNNQLTFTGTLPEIPASLKKNPSNGAVVSFAFDGAYNYGDFSKPIEDIAELCKYTIWVVPSETVNDLLDINNASLEKDGGGDDDDDEDSNRHVVLTSVVAVMFAVLITIFLIYDWLVEKRQTVVVNIATKSSAIVENLFPAQVRDRMLQNMMNTKKDGAGGGNNGNGNDPNNGDSGSTPIDSVSKNILPAGPGAAPGPVSVKQFLSDGPTTTNTLSSQPIADLFANTTVLFADIAGFTAWSSQRDPPQVFTLLETLYRSFDVIAKRLKVFKVETIGDCYMAVTGLPNPDDAHAVHMARFAYQCLVGMKELTRELESMLGPGTSDLALRVGLHSGPVTAGVLRGEKSRFQLFGDTVNTASRMESTGFRGKIQISQETADLLMAAGKSHWLKAREEAVVAKGKGELKTYWLDPTKKSRRNQKGKDRERDIRVAPEISINGAGPEKSPAPGEVAFDDKYARLIDWNVDVLLHHLARVISTRSRSPSRGSLVNHSSEVALLPAAINDVAEVVALPPFDSDASRFRRARPDVSMLQQTRADLHEYVKRIAVLYHDVPFHNFEHASHVTLCANKLLNRLINSEEYKTEEELHNSTFGISSDPLTHFAIVFAALIHDVDHTGLPNAQLVKDKHELAIKFNNRSVAEQNSVHMGWEMLMDPRFERLRKCIYQTNVERKRFRQLVINATLATDIADRQVNEERQQKWERAFKESNVPESQQTAIQMQEDMNRKATAVIEHIIQVSDVAHTMQHWHIYRRWNERLFHEMHEAFSSGKVSVDPSTNWYIGELGFFDYYLIPLAMKLKECGVFGASGYEYISYVLKNKKEWERKGRQVVQEMVLLYKDVEEEEASGSSFASEDYDSDDLEYDSPGDMSSSEEEEDGED